MKNIVTNALAIALVAAISPGLALAQTPFAGEDFDGGSTNGGLTAVTEVFTPDLRFNGAAGPDDPADSGTFPSSGFDKFGEISSGAGTFGGFVPFDLVDDSAGSFPPDSFGILDSTKTDRVVVLADTENSSNSGPVTAEWTFDITGRSNIELGIDFAAIGQFEADDQFAFTYQVDSNPAETAFLLTGDETNPIVFYGITMEAGAFLDRYDNPFFSNTEHTFLLNNGAGSVLGGSTLNFHPLDDGATNGDTVANDGQIPVDGLFGPTEELAYQETNSNGTFENTEFEAFFNPLFTDGDSINGTGLNDDFQTLTSAINGTGSTLTLTLTAVTDGSLEWFVFDNITLTELATTPGDLDGDGSVTAADYALARSGVGATGVPATDVATWIANFTTSAPAVAGASVPEPTSAFLLVLTSLCGISVRRR